MAYFLIRRLWDGEIVPLCVLHTSQGHAMAMLGLAFCLPGKRTGDPQAGDVYLDVQHERSRHLLAESVVFPVDAARPVLAQLEMPADQIDVVLSEACVTARRAVIEQGRGDDA